MTARHATSGHEAKCCLLPRRGEGRPAPGGPSPRPRAPRGPPSVSPRCPSTTPARPALTAQLGPGLLASRLDVCDGLRPVSFRPGFPSLNAVPYAAARAVRSPHWLPPFWPATLGRGGGLRLRPQGTALASPVTTASAAHTLPRLPGHAGRALRPPPAGGQRARCQPRPPGAPGLWGGRPTFKLLFTARPRRGGSDLLRGAKGRKPGQSTR